MPEVIEGMQDLLQSLERLSRLDAEKVMNKALKDAGRLLAEEQEHLAPRDSGKLAANIRVVISERTASHVIARIGPSRKVFYAMFQNFGFRSRAGDHFVERAWNNKKDEVYAIIRYQLGAFIEKAWGKTNG